jgi:hypothetical protein
MQSATCNLPQTLRVSGEARATKSCVHGRTDHGRRRPGSRRAPARVVSLVLLPQLPRLCARWASANFNARALDTCPVRNRAGGSMIYIRTSIPDGHVTSISLPMDTPLRVPALAVAWVLLNHYINNSAAWNNYTHPVISLFVHAIVARMHQLARYYSRGLPLTAQMPNAQGSFPDEMPSRHINAFVLRRLVPFRVCPRVAKDSQYCIKSRPIAE